MLNIQFDTDNAVFADNGHADEIKLILKKIASTISINGPVDSGAKVYDSSGNHIGKWYYIHEHDDLEND
jgi:hypothetical protein